ncbi:MAG: RsmB/NOP family class I SAM-dependent RNA methyltransferase [Aestuariivirga sp.]
MRLAGRIAAAIDILDEILTRRRPASEALKDWGKAHRFAGSGDRHAIGTLVYDALRQRNSLGFRMEDQSPRALALGALRFAWNLTPDVIAETVKERFGPGELSNHEWDHLSKPKDLSTAPPHIAGDFPEWLTPSFARAFGNKAAEEGAALARRAPIDLRANTLKATRAQVLEALGKYGAVEGPLSPWCVRVPAPGPEERHRDVEAEPAHGLGWFEVQDAASQIAAMLSGANVSERVADICAGAGGKTLALAAMMQNQVTLVAYDSDKHRLRPIFERLTRAGATDVQVIAADEAHRLTEHGPYDCLVIDAPCSGSGAWRRKPDAKWRLTEKQLQQRFKDQSQVLEKGFELARPGGRIVYMTCSVLPEENADQVRAFMSRHPGLSIIPYTDLWSSGDPPPQRTDLDGTLLLTPASTDTDGFFVAVMRKSSLPRA